MIRNWIRNISLPVWLIMTILTGCIDETGLGNLQSENVSEGNVSLCFSVNVPDMTEVVTRSVDEDATGVETIRLFCFDKNGLFITTATTSSHTQGEPNEDGYYLEGTFTAEVPNYTHIVHLVANQNLDNFNETEWLGKSEAEVMTTLTATSNRMIYWGRVEANEGETMAAAMQRVSGAYDGGIVMIRDQAKVTVTVNTDAGFTLTAGYFVCNTNAFGTIAPYNRTTNAFDWRTADPKYITLPTETARATTPQDVSNQEAQYVFETQNDLSDPVSVIIKGQNEGEDEKYYRVLILDNATEEPMPILRNHHYQIQVTGKLSYGYSTFAEALKGAATNNIWISIADEINTVSDGTKTLSVNETYVVTEGQENASIPYRLTYTYTEKGVGVTEAEAPVVSWVTGENNVAQSTISTAYDSGTGAGTIQISLLPMEGNSKREGTLLVKKGKLQRTIKIITVKKMTFTPAWVSTGIYSNASNQHVTMMFNIPEDCPDELLPIRVLISIDHMDVRNASGMQLSVITKTSNPDEYGEDNGIGYKYVYEVAEKGTQRVYFETVLSDDAPDNVVFEAPFFETLSKTFTYSTVQKAISLEGLSVYKVGNIEDDGFAEDDVIYYKLVPQKINAFVDFTIGIDNNGTPENIGVSDEFLLYSQYLSAYDDSDFPINGVQQPQCTFVAVDESQWSTSGRVFGFYPRDYSGGDTQKTIYMHTNRPNSAEVVRISSNQNGSISIKSSENYNGGVYRSVVFELANYNPFTFNSSIKGSNDKKQQWTYEYGQQVDVKFDITSFTGSDGKQVDPFGTAFNVYIDAPMLEIDESRRPQGINETKFYQGADGRFVYVVDKDETIESNFFNGTVKTLPFKTSKIVSAGEITISADEDVVIFDSETYTITNQLITGTIQYGNPPLKNVPANAFVAFERTRDGTRIGRVNVLSDGTYELLLRGEYSYAWSGDEHIAMYYLAEDGIEYVAQFDNLATLFANRNVILK
ncbi:hypothetical protein H6A30_07170 [Bacteroides caecigallinarum]|uniref:hypothetical protein n=1 Tax=Bacteroides caecigallinarum TaxID=1411144 RepID=UPI001958DE0F|nr:hypothetical protein [Bacteroides caecigallinarum]MBM6890055.1 hypothetical protein [Bacteroides caecigallinarum]